MPVRLESGLQRRCVKEAREKGWMAMKVETISNVGWPDVLFVPPVVGNARVIWIEFKAEGKTLSPIQEHVQKELAKRGQRVYTVRTREEFRNLIDHAHVG